jgi:hypothetical protein
MFALLFQGRLCDEWGVRAKHYELERYHTVFEGVWGVCVCENPGDRGGLYNANQRFVYGVCNSDLSCSYYCFVPFTTPDMRDHFLL